MHLMRQLSVTRTSEAVRLGWLGWLAPPPLAWAGGVRGAARARGRERWDADILREGAPLNFFSQKNRPDTEKVLKCGGRIRIMGLMEGLVGAGEVVIGIDTALGPDEGMVEDVAVPALGEVISDPYVLRFLRFVRLCR